MARRSGQSPLPPPLEIACLGALWTMREGTVRDVAAALAPRQTFAYTTVMTLLERLVKRGQLTRRKAGRSFVYAPAQDPAELREIAIGELARDYFGGSRDALRAWLDGAAPTQSVREAVTNEPIDTALL
ncbi:MAG: BlaI/MecI/CopY family transcriptional regulator [Bryobacteraceae bacterium]